MASLRDLSCVASGCAVGFVVAYAWTRAQRAAKSDMESNIQAAFIQGGAEAAELLAARAQIAALTLRAERAESIVSWPSQAASIQKQALEATKQAKATAAEVTAVAQAMRMELLEVEKARHAYVERTSVVSTPPPTAQALALVAEASGGGAHAGVMKVIEDDNVSLSTVRTDGAVTADEDPAWMQESSADAATSSRATTVPAPVQDGAAQAPAYPVAAEEQRAVDAPLPEVDEIGAPYATVDALTKEGEHADALARLTEALARRPKDALLLWRLARAHKKLADACDEKAPARERHMDEGLRHATAALLHAPNLGASHKWYAIMLGSKPGSTGEKIKSSFVVKDHFDTAAELDPKDPTSRHLVGLWCYEVAKLSWLEKRAAAVIFAAPPESTYDEAYLHLAQAERLEPGFYAQNRLLLAHCCHQMGQGEEARRWLADVKAMTPRDADEVKTLREAQKLRF